MNKIVKHIVIGGALVISIQAFAQHKNFDTIEYRVVEQANANIANGAKLNSNPSIADTTKPVRKVDYSTVNLPYGTSYTPDALRPVQLKGEPVEKLEHSFIEAGGGNYNTLYLEGFYNALQSRNLDYGVHVNHYSSDYYTNSYEKSNFSYNDVNLYGTSYMENHTLVGQLDFDQRVVHDYGYDIAKDSLENLPSNDITRERYNNFDGSLKFTSHYKDSSMINHDIKASYYNYQDLYGTVENNVDLNAHLFTYIQHQRLDVKALVQYYNDATAMGSSHQWNLGINPYFSAEEKHWDAHLGLKAYLDAVNGGTNLFPDLLVRYHVANDALLIYAGIDGDKDFNSYKSLSTMNPFIQDTVNMQYTRTMYHLFLGFTGSITNTLTYDINGSLSQIKNMPLFITDTMEQLRNRFEVIYDDVQIFNAHAELAYQMKEDIRFTLGGDYYHYVPGNQVAVWYHPTLKLNLLGEYVVNKQLTLKAEFFYLNSQYAPQMVDGVMTAKTLAGYPDLNLGAEYKYSKLVGIFLNLNNLANTHYLVWDEYPTQGFSILGGVKLTF